MAETELTVQVANSYDEIVNKLERQGYVLDRSVRMEDFYFSALSAEDVEHLSTAALIGKSVLVRKLSGGENRNLVIYKNKNYDKDGNVVSEDKVQTEVGDANKLVKILSGAGLRCWIEMEQELHIFRNYRHEICIQEVDGLGTFIEYEENEYQSGMDLETKIACMKQDLEGLGLDLGKDFFVKKLDLYRTTLEEEFEQ